MINNNYRTIIDGDTYLTPLSIAGVISRSFYLLHSNFVFLYKVVIGSYLPTIVLTLLTYMLLPEIFQFALHTSADIVSTLQTVVPYSLLSYLCTVAVNAASVTLVAYTYAGIELRFDNVLKVMQKCTFRIFLASVVQLSFPLFLLTLVGLACKAVSPVCMIPVLLIIVVLGLYAMISMSLYNAAIVVEGKNFIASLQRSCTLTLGYRLDMLYTLIAVGVIFEFLYISCGSLLWALLGPGHSTLYFLVGTIPGYIFLPFLRIMETVIYFNLRVQKEQMRQTELLSDLGARNNPGTQIYECVDIQEEVL